MTPLQVIKLIKHCISDDEQTFEDTYANIASDHKFSTNPEEKVILKELMNLLDSLRLELYR